jgi:2-dehydropantoate 2-reductase
MRICVYGAGAIGGHLAVRLARGGADVSVLARGAHLAAIQRNGLVVRTTEGQLHGRVLASDDPKSLGPQDAVLVTVKAPALPAIASGIGPLLKPETSVAFVMNGIPWFYFHGIGGELEGRHADT